ncbi:class I SAM-dependent methyltransferase [Aestuariivirga litoralis]|uniref:class I SAM-dependent methyltransferase n=1 Tax=Aestuariivirga litoralis TaxID=2650924 RepID=UPI0018C81E53|nr:class I SAM-dependent methyltransferase [Aestuariivirga litoralis]
MKALDSLRATNNQRILDHLGLLFRGKRLEILDVGCGHGQFLAEAGIKGHSVIGIEPDQDVAEMTRRRMDVKVLSGYFPEGIAPKSTFDVILFNDVFEHLPDPNFMLNACRLHLKTGGIVVINSPDRRGIFYFIATILDKLGISGPFYRMWQVGLPSPHLWYYNPRNIELLSSKHGFQVVSAHPLLPIARKNLWERIRFAKDQSLLLSVLVFVSVWPIISLLRLLPKDSFVAYIGRTEDVLETH